jgi:CheY-like chemotaxis protein/HPt (histidine-containing phosphotransfer) domain-containing protein
VQEEGTLTAPARPAEAGVRLRPLVIAAVGGATRVVLSDSAQGLGLDCILCEPGASSAGEADWVLDAAALVARGSRPAGARRVLAVAAMGDPTGTRALERGLADTLLRRPLVQSELRVVLERLVTGEAFDKPAASSAQVGDAPPQFHGARVLVADDSAVNREVACEALARLGITPTTVENGQQAFDAVRTTEFDIVLMDGSMPVIDGFQATRLIREHEAATGGRRTPVVALTAHVVGAGAELWREAGMDGVLHKPFTVAKLAECLSQWIAPSKAVPKGPEAAAPAARAAEPVSAEDALLDAENLAQLEAMAGSSGGEFIARVVGLYVDHAPKALDELCAAIEAADAERVAPAAHSLKSMSLNIGASALARRLAEMEAAARQRGELPSEEAVAVIGRLLDETIGALRGHFRLAATARAA